MKSFNFKDLNLSLEESRDIIEFLARKRGGKKNTSQTMNYCLLSKSLKNLKKSSLKIKNE